MDLIQADDAKYGVNPEIGLFIALHESQDNPSVIGDIGYVCNLPTSPYYGLITPSYGLYQINQCAHANITIASSLDPIFAANWAAQQIAAGNENEWSSWAMRCQWYKHSPKCFPILP